MPNLNIVPETELYQAENFSPQRNSNVFDSRNFNGKYNINLNRQSGAYNTNRSQHISDFSGSKSPPPNNRNNPHMLDLMIKPFRAIQFNVD